MKAERTARCPFYSDLHQVFDSHRIGAHRPVLGAQNLKVETLNESNENESNPKELTSATAITIVSSIEAFLFQCLGKPEPSGFSTHVIVPYSENCFF